MSILYETILSRLGSRFHLNFLPRENAVRLSPMGRFYDELYNISIGVRVGNHVRILPFSDSHPHFEKNEQYITPTSVTYISQDESIGIKMETKITAPFYPQDEVVSSVPLFIIELKIKNIGNSILKGDYVSSDKEATYGHELFIQIENLDENDIFPLEKGFGFKTNSTIDPALAKLKWLDKTEGKEFSSASYSGEIGLISCSEVSSLKNGEINIIPSSESKQSINSFIIASYTNQDVLNIEDELFKFKYVNWFKSLRDILDYGQKNINILYEKSKFFDDLILLSSTGQSMSNLISLSFQSYLSNTWLVVNESEEDWFSVWEGNCAYHSTIDVEYNIAPFYLMLWPELLEKTINQWVNYEKEGAIMSHDMGKFLVIKGMQYNHDMVIEENSNFLLLVYAHYKFTGNQQLIQTHYGLLKRLMDKIYQSDTTGNGFPNVGTANTIDDAGPAVQYSNEQVYLAIKALSCYQTFKEIAKLFHDNKWIKKCTEMTEKINSTLEKEWLGDHYPVCIDKHTTGVVNAWTGSKLSGDLIGWDAYSIYAPNGLLYPLMTNAPLDINTEKILNHIAIATEKSMTQYGCKHSDMDDTGLLWISQNIWKDCIAAYLNSDMLDLSEKYWDLQLYENSQESGGCFVETYPKNHLNYYPRGLASIGLIIAMGGVKIDTANKEIHLAPARVPCNIPLTFCAEWESARVSWVKFSLENGSVVYKITNKDLISDFTLTVYGKRCSL